MAWCCGGTLAGTNNGELLVEVGIVDAKSNTPLYKGVEYFAVAFAESERATSISIKLDVYGVGVGLIPMVLEA